MLAEARAEAAAGGERMHEGQSLEFALLLNANAAVEAEKHVALDVDKGLLRVEGARAPRRGSSARWAARGWPTPRRARAPREAHGGGGVERHASRVRRGGGEDGKVPAHQQGGVRRRARF